jgi:hypothetical protein
MPTTEQTRIQVRQAIGRNLMGSRFKVSTSTSSGSIATLVDTTLRGGDNVHNGKYIWTSAEDATRVDDYTQSTWTLTLFPAITTTPSGLAYEMWDHPHDPVSINDIIKQVILEAFGRTWVPVSDESLFADGLQRRFAIPTGVDMIQRLFYRDAVPSTLVHACGAPWDESVDSGVTVAVDTKNSKRGSGANRFLVNASVSTNVILATDSFASLDATGYTHLEFWVYSTVAAAAGDFQILLDDTASCASPVETLDVPALTARTWQRVTVALANPELDSALISVGLKQVTDIGATYISLDDIVLTTPSEARWERMKPDSWHIDKEARELVLTSTARVNYAQLKLVGGKDPTVPTADATVIDIDASYVIFRATEIAMGITGDLSDANLSLLWAGRANSARRGLPKFMDVHRVE